MFVACRWGIRPADVLDWAESEINLCIAHMKRDPRYG